jgi:hypothetical protein
MAAASSDAPQSVRLSAVSKDDRTKIEKAYRHIKCAKRAESRARDRWAAAKKERDAAEKELLACQKRHNIDDVRSFAKRACRHSRFDRKIRKALLTEDEIVSTEFVWKFRAETDPITCTNRDCWFLTHIDNKFEFTGCWYCRYDHEIYFCNACYESGRVNVPRETLLERYSEEYFPGVNPLRHVLDLETYCSQYGENESVESIVQRARDIDEWRSFKLSQTQGAKLEQCMQCTGQDDRTDVYVLRGQPKVVLCDKHFTPDVRNTLKANAIPGRLPVDP